MNDRKDKNELVKGTGFFSFFFLNSGDVTYGKEEGLRRQMLKTHLGVHTCTAHSESMEGVLMELSVINGWDQAEDLGKGVLRHLSTCIRNVRRGRWVFLGKRKDYSSSSVEM